MPYRKVAFRAGEVYHVYNRGANRQPIFFCAENWGFMLRLLRRYFVPDLVDILAYCLMPNHYHLMVRLKVDDFSKQMMHLSRYIHRNPVDAGLVATAEAWLFSSYKDYIGLREGTLPRPDDVLALFPSRPAYREFVETEQDWSVIAGMLLE